jgi:hypothetical protein
MSIFHESTTVFSLVTGDLATPQFKSVFKREDKGGQLPPVAEKNEKIFLNSHPLSCSKNFRPKNVQNLPFFQQKNAIFKQKMSNFI